MIVKWWRLVIYDCEMQSSWFHNHISPISMILQSYITNLHDFTIIYHQSPRFHNHISPISTIDWVIYDCEIMEIGDIWLQNHGDWWYMIVKSWRLVIYDYEIVEIGDIWLWNRGDWWYMIMKSWRLVIYDCEITEIGDIRYYDLRISQWYITNLHDFAMIYHQSPWFHNHISPISMILQSYITNLHEDSKSTLNYLRIDLKVLDNQIQL
jgi:hypothetical protein